MFGQSFHERAERHLNVFRKAVEGLKQVKNDINDEIGRRELAKRELEQDIKTHQIDMMAMAQHADQIENTISKLNVLLPVATVQQ